MCFFDKYESLCKAKGKSVNAVAKEIGLSSGITTIWKKQRSTPRLETINKVANYFHISMESLMEDVMPGGETEKEKPLVNNDEELTELLERVKNNPHLRMLFSLTKNATTEDIKQAVKIIQALKGD